MGQIGKAFELALAAHAGQSDRAGAPYIGHVARVAASIPDGPDAETAQVVALLHDVVEDTDVTLETIEREFGPGIAATVDALTHREDEPPEDYHARIKADPLAITVKCADLEDNSDPARLAVLPDVTRKRLEQKYAATRAALEE
ncbi:probable GTP pyrophosphokinase [Pseudooceanicola batsensis HTCC2597]|uniref:Probable GTP pyrophosphokinase n=1 Tax=Pseudooceanicola batsensis (strain ATCC BAA-863 / DSM 15984 / KCTC 12145 / HTCC2597) TaxID=252305 RepID=A3U0N0_PSEBH|nr:HD domain-containing protein [Pseudooceanicola batsensis]EAQ02321.1 probable GTP pyrophosphokinase [Pseudooceanicola batsensis HTCC2597]